MNITYPLYHSMDDIYLGLSVTALIVEARERGLKMPARSRRAIVLAALRKNDIDTGIADRKVDRPIMHLPDGDIAVKTPKTIWDDVADRARVKKAEVIQTPREEVKASPRYDNFQRVDERNITVRVTLGGRVYTISVDPAIGRAQLEGVITDQTGLSMLGMWMTLNGKFIPRHQYDAFVDAQALAAAKSGGIGVVPAEVDESIPGKVPCNLCDRVRWKCC